MLTVEVPRDAIVRALWGWGYLQNYQSVQDAVLFVEPDELAKAVEAYQAFNGLVADGVVGPQTTAKMVSPARCGLPDMMGMGDCKWPMKRVSFLSRLNLGLRDAGAVMQQAAEQWNAVCGIELVRVTTESDANIVADDYGNTGDQFGRAGGVLADSHLPCGATARTRLQQRYDTGERWTDEMLLAVACHELGHAIGLPHLSAGSLLQPYYDPRITKPQKNDIEEVVRRYGPPSPRPSPSPLPPSGAPEVEVFVVMGGIKYVAKGTMRPAG